MERKSARHVGGFCLFMLFVLLIVLAPRALSAATTSIPGYVLVETITVPIDGSSIVSTTTLESGVGYKIRASGTFNVGGPGDGLADAEYIDFSNPPGSVQDISAGCPACPPGLYDYGIGINDPVVSDGKQSPSWGDFNSTHQYTIDFVGLGAPISLNYHDDKYNDNFGSLTVEIFQSDDNQPLTISSFTASTAKAVLPLNGSGVSVTFTVTTSDSDGPISQVQWDLDGDETVDQTTTDLTTSFTYTTAGAFTARVTVTGNGGATASATTTVTIQTTTQAIEDLITSVQGLSLTSGQKNSLISKLNAASDAINRGNLTATCNQLDAFINEISALVQSKQLDQATGNKLINDAEAIESAVGCS